jgi:hypothetical protein
MAISTMQRLYYVVLALIHVELFAIPTVRGVAYEDCFVSDYGVRDCGWGTFWSFSANADLLEGDVVYSTVSDFHFNYAMNWTYGGDAAVRAEQRIYANVSGGAMHYVYTKLTDRPEYKIVSDLSVTVSYLNYAVKLPACKVAKDLSDIESRKWERCYILTISQYYVGLKVYPPENTIGGSACDLCTTELVTVEIEYTLEMQVCSVIMKHPVGAAAVTSNAASSTNLEGRAYIFYIADWRTPPVASSLQFRWPEGSVPTSVAMGTGSVTAPAGDGSFRFAFGNDLQLSSVSYLSWSPMALKSPCYYGPNMEQKAGSLFVSLFVISVVLCFVMLILLAWSKHASWKWHGGDFEWDAESRTSSIDDSVAPNAEEPARQRRLSLSTILEEANSKTSAILNPIFREGDSGMPKGIEMLAVHGEKAWGAIEDKSKSVVDSVHSALEWSTLSKLPNWNAPAGSTRLSSMDDEDDEDGRQSREDIEADGEARSRRNPLDSWQRLPTGDDTIVRNPIFSEPSPRDKGFDAKSSY